MAAVIAGLAALAAPTATSRGATSLDLAYALAIQPDGKLVVAGRSAFGGWRFALARYTGRGKLDPTFGTGGKVVTALGSHGYNWAAALAIQPDGKLVAAGQSGSDFAVGRFTARGRLDPAFGRGGGTLTGALARYTTRGKLNRGFGRRGELVTAFGSDSQALAVAVQRDGKILAAGTTFDGHRAKFALARYTADGRLDPRFGRGGKVVTTIGSWNEGTALAIQPDGKLVVAGEADDDFALARYTADGRLDPSFGGGGTVVTNFGVRQDCRDCGYPSTDKAHAVAVQADGKIVAAGASDLSGRSGDKNCCFDDFALARYTADGRLDASFGSGGKVLTQFADNAIVHSIAIERDGKIAAAGGGAGYFALARYTSAGKLDPTFGDRGRITTRFRGY